jgi:Transposase IS116/IS110/IS902 family
LRIPEFSAHQGGTPNIAITRAVLLLRALHKLWPAARPFPPALARTGRSPTLAGAGADSHGPIMGSTPPADGVGGPGWCCELPAATAFRSGRHLAAWLGLVPRQHASGGKVRQLGLSKRGDGYLRRQLIHGARALVWRARPGRQAGSVARRLAATPAVQCRGRRGRPQAGTDPLGDAPSRRGLSRCALAPASGPTFHELRGRTSR